MLISNNRLSYLILGLLTASLILAPQRSEAREPDWSAYNAILQQYVQPGNVGGTPLNFVHYARIKSDSRWPGVVNQVAQFPVAQLADRNERLAFYINAYNILAINLIVQNNPVRSINDLKQGDMTVWKRTAGTVGGREISLDELEHGIIRGMGEARIHFAVVCASVGCPDLRREAYMGAKLNAQLSDQTRSFLRNPAKGLRMDGNVARVSKLFEWFRSDFEKQSGSVQGFLKQYRPDLPVNLMIRTDLPYDWSLNGR